MRWTAMTAEEQPMYEEESRSWMSLVMPSRDNEGLIRVYGPTKEQVEQRAQVIADAMSREA